MENNSKIDLTNIEDSVQKLIEHFDKNPNREGLKDTPKRFVKFMTEFLNPPKFNFTTFESEGYDEIVLVKDIQFTSFCEHHLAMFSGYGHIAYLPDKKIIGISKLPRTLELYSRRFQNQERITKQVADRLKKELEPKGVAVILNAKHSCMGCRGVKKHEASTTTSFMSGVFREDLNARNELLNLIKLSK